jgi:hypothetical protein
MITAALISIDNEYINNGEEDGQEREVENCDIDSRASDTYDEDEDDDHDSLPDNGIFTVDLSSFTRSTLDDKARFIHGFIPTLFSDLYTYSARVTYNGPTSQWRRSGFVLNLDLRDAKPN